MTLSKRIFDIACSVCLAILLSPVLTVVSIMIAILDGRPIFFMSERMKSPTDSFTLIKFRTMVPVPHDSGVTGGNKINRLTRTGSFLRRHRLDEIPQLWNIFRGDMSFVGPRPPLRQYVRRFPLVYNQVLKSRPGVTGLASVIFHQHEEALLGNCATEQETNETYERRCIPTKAKLDLMYQKRPTLCFDLTIMMKTLFRSLPVSERKLFRLRK